MAITLGAITLPAGLAWSDEFGWAARTQSTEYSLTGALIVEQAVRQAGRPITLIGQSSGNDHTAWITRANLLLLQTQLAAGTSATLTLHDARTFSVIARLDSDSPIDADPLPVAGSFLPANPQTTDWYLLRAVRLLTV